MAQKKSDESLTEEFSKLSAKERARIAKQEQEDAKGDPAYQSVMTAAEDDFQHARYEEALAGYEEGRKLRPLNVYPKVKIQDVQALIKKRDEEKARTVAVPVVEPSAVVETPAVIPPPVKEPEARSSPPVIAKIPEAPPREPLAEPAKPAPKVEPEVPPTTKPMRVVKTATPVVRSSDEAPALEQRPLLPDGTRENKYREGNADVIERVVTAAGRSTIYKRVENKWGQVFYFEDGLPIDARVWTALFGD